MGNITRRSFKRLTLNNRREIQRQYELGVKIRTLASNIGYSYQTVYRELQRGYTGKLLPDLSRYEYDAEIAQRTAVENQKKQGKLSAKK